MFLINEVKIVSLNETDSIIVNLINGAADLIDKNLSNQLLNNDLDNLADNIINTLLERKYLFSSRDEYDLFIKNLDHEIENVEIKSLPNFLIIPTYNCNLQCIYCYEKKYSISHLKIYDHIHIIDHQFSFINNILNDYKNSNEVVINSKDIDITLMGGEPLMKKNISIIRYILSKISTYGYSCTIVTNGFDLEYFINDLVKYEVNKIQITIDGPKNIHDKRRRALHEKGSFDQIIANIEKALFHNLSIRIRVNVDNENINDLPFLAKIIIDKFGSNPNIKPYLYFMQDGGCSGNSAILDEVNGIEKIFDLELKHPELSIFEKKFHLTSLLSGIKGNDMFQPSLRHCSASANQYILDYKGNIYKCWHGVGNDRFRVGKFYPEFNYNKLLIEWKNRSVDKIDICSDCKYRYICGTGCPAANHKDYDTIKLDKASCISFDKLIDTALRLSNIL